MISRARHTFAALALGLGASLGLAGCLGIEDIPEPLSAEQYAERLFELSNQQRDAEETPLLEWSDCIEEQQAGPRAAQIPAEGDLTHDTLTSVCTEGVEAGENLSRSNEAPEVIVQRWMDSPGHAANILNREFDEVGIACVALEEIADLPRGQQPVMACSQVFEGT